MEILAGDSKIFVNEMEDSSSLLENNDFDGLRHVVLNSFYSLFFEI